MALRCSVYDGGLIFLHSLLFNLSTQGLQVASYYNLWLLSYDVLKVIHVTTRLMQMFLVVNLSVCLSTFHDKSSYPWRFRCVSAMNQVPLLAGDPVQVLLHRRAGCRRSSRKRLRG